MKKNINFAGKLINSETMQISRRISAMSPSATLAMAQKSRELSASGVNVINLAVGEPDFPTPEHIKAAAGKAIEDNFTHYTPVAGYLSLRQAIADKLFRENNVTFSPEQIVVGNGAKQALCNVILSIINPGDEVLIPTPAWVSYMEMVKLAEGRVVEIPATLETEFKISPEQLKAAITPRTRAIILCSPSNPTGAIYTADELSALVEVLSAHKDITVISDEIYEHINFTGTYTSVASFPSIADRTVIINGVSKAYSMTGWRIGYCAAPIEIAKAVTKLQGQYTSNPSSIAQKAAEAAYTGSQECVKEMNRQFELRRNLVVRLAGEIPGLRINRPAGAFYLFPNVSSLIGKRYGERVIANSGDLALYILEQGHVATVDGAAFCCPGHIRISYAASEQTITEAFSRIKKALSMLE